MQASALPSEPAAMPLLRGAALKPGTLFVAVGDGTLPGSVVFSSPPYTTRSETASEQHSRRFASSTNRFITSVEMLPGETLAIGSRLNGPHRSLLAGSLDIYRPPFSTSTTIAPPYNAVTKIFARLPNKAFASAVTSGPASDIFVNEGGVLEAATATDAKGNLFFGSTAQSRVCGGFTIYRLPVPYTAKPTALFCTPGIPAGMVLSH